MDTQAATSLFKLLDGPSKATNLRREVKFALPLADLEKLRTILEVNLRRQVFAGKSSHVSSIYFDDHGLSACHENINGVEKRGKLRLRWYDGSDQKFFFEVKRRIGSVLDKRRLAIESAEPFGLQRFDFFEDRFSRLTRDAVEKDKISLSRGAEMLGIGIEKMQDLMRNWEVVL